MRQILLHNWKIKLASLMLAFVVWYVIQHSVNPAAEGRERAAAERRERR
jgi:hypothetical protein